MINRLVAENTLKVPFKGQPYFAINKKLLAFQIEGSIRVKALYREAKDIDIPINNIPLQFILSEVRPWLYILNASLQLEIYLIRYEPGVAEGTFRKISALKNVLQFKESKNGLVLRLEDRSVRFMEFEKVVVAEGNASIISLEGIPPMMNSNTPITINCSLNGERLYISFNDEGIDREVITRIFQRDIKTSLYQQKKTLRYLQTILGIYRDRYVFESKSNKFVEIYDTEDSKLIGKFEIQGTIKHSEIRENLMVIISNKQNTDYFTFLVLAAEPHSQSPLLINRATYQKGKGDFCRIFNMQSVQATLVLQKKKNTEITDNIVHKITQNTSTVLYILNKAKEKIEIIKLDHSKILKAAFQEERLNISVVEKKEENVSVPVVSVPIIPTIPTITNVPPIPNLPPVPAIPFRLQPAIVVPPQPQPQQPQQPPQPQPQLEQQNNNPNLQQLQRRFVQNLIDLKLRQVMCKFNELQRKVKDLELTLSKINEKVQVNFQKINRQEIKQNVEKLFDKLTPQFEKYFSEIFKQVAGVLDQGVSYYNLKLAKEADFHKEALVQIVNETFKVTQQVAEEGKCEQSVSEKMDEYLKRLLETKRKWTRSTEEFEERARDVPMPVIKPPPSPTPSSPAEGKVFVRADLNYPSSKRET